LNRPRADPGHRRSFTDPPWQPTDDRVRGGSSQSYLSPLLNNGAFFNGTLDIKTLGGAGFASQFSPENEDGNNGQSRAANVDKIADDGKAWDLSAYDGIEVDIGNGDGKVYTLILKDDRSPSKGDDGREQASISWEVDFEAREGGGKVWKPWKDFKAMFRGKQRENVGSLRTDRVRRVGIMMRR